MMTFVSAVVTTCFNFMFRVTIATTVVFATAAMIEFASTWHWFSKFHQSQRRPTHNVVVFDVVKASENPYFDENTTISLMDVNKQRFIDFVKDDTSNDVAAKADNVADNADDNADDNAHPSLSEFSLPVPVMIPDTAAADKEDYVDLLGLDDLVTKDAGTQTPQTTQTTQTTPQTTPEAAPQSPAADAAHEDDHDSETGMKYASAMMEIRDVLQEIINDTNTVYFVTFNEDDAPYKHVFIRGLFTSMDACDINVIDLRQLFYYLNPTVSYASYEDVLMFYSLPKQAFRHMEYIALFDRMIQDFIVNPSTPSALKCVGCTDDCIRELSRNGMVVADLHDRLSC